MPLQPQFDLKQDDEFVYVRVKVPFVRISEAELSIDGPDLQFFCKPYLLKLTFPGRLVDDERARAVYDIGDSHGTIEIFAPKETRGEEFADLDLVTRLLQPRKWAQAGGGSSLPPPAGNTTDEDSLDRLTALSLAEASVARAPGGSRPLIEVISSVDFATSEGDGRPDAELGGRPDLTTSAAPPPAALAAPLPLAAGSASLPQAPTSPALGEPTPLTSHAPEPLPLPSLLPVPPRYGFNRQHAGLFQGLRAEMPGVVDVPDPDSTPPLERRRLREAAESAAFDPERFAADLDEGGADPVYAEAVTMRPWWASAGTDGAAPWAWTAEEVTELASLGNRELLVDGHVVGGCGTTGTGSRGGAGASVAPQPLLPALVELRPDADGLLHVVDNRGGGDDGETTSTPQAVVNTDDKRGGAAVAPDASDAPSHPGLGDASCEPEAFRLLIGLPALLAAYAYDHRMTGGEPTCESGWGIATLCPLLSWLDDSTLGEAEAAAGSLSSSGPPPPALLLLRPTQAVGAAAPGASVTGDIPRASEASPPPTVSAELRACARTFLRRALVYPYLRRWDLGILALSDAAGLLLSGRRAVLRALLAVRRVLAGEEARYLLNRLVLDDYCRWLQFGERRSGLRNPGEVSDASLAWLGTELSQAACSFALLVAQGPAGPLAAPSHVGLAAEGGDAGEDGESGDDGSSDSEASST